MSTIVQISDCHLFENLHKCGHQQINPYHSLTAILRQAQSHCPDALLVTGDISGDDSEQSYLHFLQLVEQHQLLSKLKVIPGNHDNNLWFDTVLGQYDLSKQAPVSMSNWSLHGVDTRYKDTLGKLELLQLENLDAALNTSAADFHLLACHHHPIECGGWMDRHEWVDRSAFTELLARFNKVRLIVYGHIHTQQTTKLHNQLFVSCPASCWQWSTEPEFSVDTVAPGYNVIKLLPTGETEIQTHRLNMEPR